MRTLSPSELARAHAASKLSLSQRRAFARDFAPEVFKAWQGWVWGRQTFDLSVATIDPTPDTAFSLCSLEQIEYIARKRDSDKIARRAVYRHEHSKPYAQVVTTRAEAGSTASVISTARAGSPRFRGPAIFVLGELHAIEGTTDAGDRIYWRAPRGYLLAGCPVTHDLHIIRPARSGPPVWILRGKAPFRLTDRGIER